MVKKKIKTRGKKNLKIIKFPNRQELVIFQGKKKIEVYYRSIKINKSMYNRYSKMISLHILSLHSIFKQNKPKKFRKIATGFSVSHIEFNLREYC